MIKTNKRILQIICILLLMALILICNNHKVEAAFNHFYCLNQGYDDPVNRLDDVPNGNPGYYSKVFTYLHHNRHDCAKYYIWENYGRTT